MKSFQLLIIFLLIIFYTNLVYSSSDLNRDNVNLLQILKNGKVKKHIKLNKKIIFTAGSGEFNKNRQGRLIDIKTDSLFINTANNQNVKIQAFHINDINMIGIPTLSTKVLTGIIALISPNGIIYPFYRKYKTEKGWKFNTVPE